MAVIHHHVSLPDVTLSSDSHWGTYGVFRVISIYVYSLCMLNINTVAVIF